MVKKKLRERIRAKSDNGMINEVLCKCVCHNITVLIQEMHELKVNVDFEEANQFYKIRAVAKTKPKKLTDFF